MSRIKPEHGDIPTPHIEHRDSNTPVAVFPFSPKDENQVILIMELLSWDENKAGEPQPAADSTYHLGALAALLENLAEHISFSYDYEDLADYGDVQGTLHQVMIALERVYVDLRMLIHRIDTGASER